MKITPDWVRKTLGSETLSDDEANEIVAQITILVRSLLDSEDAGS